ncbi:MAG: hypothetical protein AAB428_03260 [Patescibacteria group bacterium]
MAVISYTNLDRIKILVREAAEKAIRTVRMNLGDKYAGSGAYIRAYRLPSVSEGYIGLNELFAAWIGGYANDDKLDMYIIVSVEKAIRLATYAQASGHVSSWESRDTTAKNKYGGAILIHCLVPELGTEPTNLIFTVSGLSEHGDEAVAILTALNLPWQANGVPEIIEKSNNNLARRLI